VASPGQRTSSAFPNVHPPYGVARGRAILLRHDRHRRRPRPRECRRARRAASSWGYRGAVGEVCPYLRDVSGAWRGAYASRDHRCAAVEPPAPLAAAKQRALCLVDSHRACSTYLAAREQAAVAEPQGPPGADLWPETRAVPLLLETARGVMALPGWLGAGGRPAILAGLMVLAAAAVWCRGRPRRRIGQP